MNIPQAQVDVKCLTCMSCSTVPGWPVTDENNLPTYDLDESGLL